MNDRKVVSEAHLFEQWMCGNIPVGVRSCAVGDCGIRDHIVHIDIDSINQMLAVCGRQYDIRSNEGTPTLMQVY